MEDRLYTTQEVAKALAVSDAHIRRMIGRGTAHPKQRIGNSWVFTLEEIERLRSRSKSRGGRPKKK